MHVYDKTDKGREEIATRKYRVAPRLRTLLVMIDGKRSTDMLMTDLSAIGLTEDSFEQLLRDDYICLVSSGPAPAPVAPPAPVVPAPVPPREAPAAAVQEAVQAVPLREHEGAPLDESERFRALYDFYNQTIKSMIGFRGIGLQLKVEKCGNIDDFRALREQYLEAVLKAKGSETAISLRDRLDTLLGGAPANDSFQVG